jgi:hypothetical protein
VDGGAVTVAVSGIVVSGVVGPWVASVSGRRNSRRAFTRDTNRQHRDELRNVFDEALRLPSEHPVIRAYDQVRTALTGLAQDAAGSDSSIAGFETARDAFLTAARETINAALTESAT